MSQMKFYSPGRTSRTAITGCALSLLAAMMMLGGFVGLRTQNLALDPGFKMFLAGSGLALISLAVSLIGWRQTRAAKGRNLVWSGIIISLLIVTPVLKYIPAAFSVPPIHDITTDTQNPTLFVDILPLRAGAPNMSDYGGADVAALQQAAYPGLAPLMLPLSPGEAFSKAQKLIEAHGWTLVAAVPGEGRIEATAETKNMRFKDDLVIRIAPAPEGSKIDMRSVSRFGKSDLGVNAKRITGFLGEMKAP